MCHVAAQSFQVILYSYGPTGLSLPRSLPMLRLFGYHRYREPAADTSAISSGIGTHVRSKENRFVIQKFGKNCNVNTFAEFDTWSLKVDARSSTCTVCPQFRRSTGGQQIAQKEAGSRYHPRKALRDWPRTKVRPSSQWTPRS